MTTFEKLLIYTVVISGLLMKVFGQYESARIPGVIASVLTITSFAGLSFYYLFLTRFSIYTFAFLLLAIGLFGPIMKTLHLPAAGAFMLATFLSTPLVMALLIKTGIELRKEKKNEVLFNFALAAIFAVQQVLAYFEHISLGQKLNYISLGIILFMRQKNIELKVEETRILNIIAIEVYLLLVSDVLNALNGTG